MGWKKEAGPTTLPDDDGTAEAEIAAFKRKRQRRRARN